uniref:carbohydrate sulfotransferase 1-like n=1 Tax=Styela clava TaxID=7725 RepID=UPI001939B17E|nr:carbohydrate sulfotransferase 1-like [Styela clava]
MKCTAKRIIHWEIWRTHRVIYVLAAAITICLTWRNMMKTSSVNPTQQLIIRQELRQEISWIKNTVPPMQKKTVVLLIANQRSGSTFVGEIFNQNPKAFYLFEPLFPFTKQCKYLEIERVDLLNDFLQCNFDNLKQAYLKAFARTKFTDKDAECMKNNICFETSHQPLLKNYAKICEYGKDENVDKQTQDGNLKFDPESPACGYPLNTTILGQICKTSDIVAYKIIRLCTIENIELIYKTLQDKGVKLFVVHLVRDPRAVVASRVNLKVDGIRLHNASAETNILCDRYNRNMKYVSRLEADSGSNIISDGRYLRIRHEDFTVNPFETAEKIYRFIGKPKSEEVERFISKSHQSMNRILDRIRREDEKALLEKKEIRNYTRSKEILHQMNNPFGTTRDAKEVLTKWRITLPYSVAQLVQEKCANVFEMLRYKMFNSKLDMVNLTKTYF